MRIEKNDQTISSIEDWRTLAGPKAAYQWKEGRSAFELARAWIGSGTPTMPPAVRTLLDSRPETAGLTVDVAFPECPIPFDDRAGEPRNADLAFVGHAGARRVAVTIEAKADEPFGVPIEKELANALERLVGNEASGGVARIVDLARSLFRPHEKREPPLGRLRYQLLTAVAGTIALAKTHDAPCSVLIVHEFATTKTRSARLATNTADLLVFIHRLGSAAPMSPLSGLVGPFSIPGSPLFSDTPTLFIGKVTTQVPAPEA